MTGSTLDICRWQRTTSSQGDMLESIAMPISEAMVN